MTATEDGDEIWLPIIGFEGLYEITATERVRSLDRFVDRFNWWSDRRGYFHRGREMQPYTPKRGPKQVVLFDKEHRRHCRTVRSLVSDAFGGRTA
ncbi:NUMOD4 domain-containing protein [Mycobacterium avium]|uniref:NUMOD4 domain-containing protein n=1 Tax=Mycobacterium avium TaxID=1764 RepID=UPI0005B3D9FA|nr:NUMOD4 domain-containing protein [Mycobacterium avium]